MTEEYPKDNKECSIVNEECPKADEVCPRFGAIAVFCVGNKLMLDEGIGPAVYDELSQSYDFPATVELFDVGCMSLNMLPLVEKYDLLITVDALEGTKKESGTVFRFLPEDMARHSSAMQSLHDLKLVDLFDAAALLGSEARGLCFGMQVENMNPSELIIGLTPKVHEALPLLVDSVLAALTHEGAQIYLKGTKTLVGPDHSHVMKSS